MADALGEVRRSLRRLRQKVAARKTRRHAATDLTEWTLNTALCIAAAFRYDMTPAVAWLTSRRRRGAAAPADADSEALRNRLEVYFLEADVDALALNMDPVSTTFARTCLQTADTFVHEYKLGTWIWSRNHLHGTVVRTAAAISYFNTSYGHSEDCAGDSVPRVPLASTSTGRNWAFRWRLKHSAKHGSLRVQEPISLDEKQTKASQNLHPSEFFFASPLESFFGAPTPAPAKSRSPKTYQKVVTRHKFPVTFKLMSSVLCLFLGGSFSEAG